MVSETEPNWVLFTLMRVVMWCLETHIVLLFLVTVFPLILFSLIISSHVTHIGLNGWSNFSAMSILLYLNFIRPLRIQNQMMNRCFHTSANKAFRSRCFNQITKSYCFSIQYSVWVFFTHHRRHSVPQFILLLATNRRSSNFVVCFDEFFRLSVIHRPNSSFYNLLLTSLLLILWH